MKFRRIFPDSLDKKLLWLIAAFAALFAANFFAYDYLLYRLDQTAAAVDTAGRQRMLSQRIAYTAALAAAGRRGAESELVKLVAEFESALFALTSGGYYRDYYVYPAPPGILPLIKKEAVLWRDYKFAAAALASSADRGRPSVRALYAIETLAGPLLTACDETTAAFRREAEEVTKLLYAVMVAIASSLLLLGGAAVWFASRKVAKPLLAMAGMARRLPAEPFDELAVAGAAGEVRTLAESLGNMSRELARDKDKRDALFRLLQISAGRGPLPELLDRMLGEMLAIPWLKLEAKGALFLADPGSGRLTLAAQRGLPPALLKSCSSVEPGHCLCGRAALGEAVFATGLDERHETAFDGMPPHGHYCLPVRSGGAVTAVLTLYLPAGHVYGKGEREFLESAGLVIAGAIEYKSLEQRAQQAQKMEALGQVAGAVAHDFNNILTVVKGFNELIQEAVPSDSEARRYSDQAAAGIEKGAELATQILAYSRAKPKARESLDLNALLAGARPMLAMAAGSKVRLEMAQGEGVPKIEADKGQLEQVLMNLTINARDAIAPGTGRLTFRTFISGGRAGLSVTDTGVGMPPEIAEKVFEPFFTTKPEGQGTGLGLATVYSIVKAHKGEIAVQSAPGKGTTFTLTFPPQA